MIAILGQETTGPAVSAPTRRTSRRSPDRQAQEEQSGPGTGARDNVLRLMIMKRLQRDTLDLHREVEALMPVMSEALTRRDYLEVLRRLQTVVVPLEAQLDALPLPDELAWPERRKAHLLALDLAVMGEGPSNQQAPLSVPELTTLAQAFGALYVLEGATLGGQLISRHLGRALGLTPQQGGAYFSGYGPQTGARWRSFGAVLEASVPAEDAAEVVAGARQTFGAFRRALQGLTDVSLSEVEVHQEPEVAHA